VSDTEFGRLLAAKHAKPAGASPAEAMVSIAAIDTNGKKVRVYRQTPPEAAIKAPVNVTTTAKPGHKKQTDVTAHVTDSDSDAHGINNLEDYVEENYYAFRDSEDEEGRCVCKPGLVPYCYVVLFDAAAVAIFERIAGRSSWYSWRGLTAQHHVGEAGNGVSLIVQSIQLVMLLHECHH
jgi:hypothetical protein